MMLFADGSWVGVGAGSFDVAAAWHEYVRDTWWGPGLMLFKVSALKEVLRDVPAGAHRLWAAKVWSEGYRVMYQPAATAVRAAPSSPVEDDAAHETWAALAEGCPERPLRLDESAWRELLAVEDVAGGWT
jgi:hypothetical protein